MTRGKGSVSLALVVFVALAVRLPLAPIDFGKTADMGIFRRWIEAAQATGPVNLYRGGAGVNYPPVSLYLLTAAGWIETHVPAASPRRDQDGFAKFRERDRVKNTLIKLPLILADAATAALIWLALRRRRSARRWATVMALSYALNPAVWYVSAYWGQMDSLYTLGLVAGIVALESGAVVPAWMAYALALATKLQSIAVAPLFPIVTAFEHGGRGLARGVAAALGVLAALAAPWWLTGRLGDLAAVLPGESPRVVVSAYNLWYLLRLGQVHNVSSAIHPPGLPLSYQTIGILLFGAYVVLVAILARRAETLALPAAALSLGMFVLLTQMHERYWFPTLAFLALAGPARPRPWGVYVLLSATFFFNLVTIAPFTEALGINLVVAEATSTKVVILKLLALAAAAVNIGALGWLTVEVARGASGRAVARRQQVPAVP